MGKPFNFARIFARGRVEDTQDETTAEETQDETTAEETQEETAAEDTQEETTAEDTPEETMAEDEPASPQAKAEARIRASERARIGSIVTSKAAAGRVEAALSVAVNTSMSAQAAIAFLNTLPAGAAAPSGGGLASRMAGLGATVPPDRGGRADAGNQGPMSFKQVQARRAERAAARTGGAGMSTLPRR